MFLDVKDLAVRKLPIRKSYAPGSIDYHTSEIKQVAPLEVNATAELFDGDIRIEGHLETKVELSLRALPGTGRRRRASRFRPLVYALAQADQAGRRALEG